MLPDRLDQNNVRFSIFISFHTCLHHTLIDICSIAFSNTAINAWQNLIHTVSVNLAGYDGVFYYFGEGQITNYDGTVLVQGQRNPYEIVTGEIHPELADQARKEWGLENNIYNLGHRGYVAKPGGESDSGLTYIKDLAEGKYHLPWEDDMDIKDGTIYGYPTTGGRFGTEPSPDPYGIHEYKGINYHTKK